jgi:hypothetical protein
MAPLPGTDPLITAQAGHALEMWFGREGVTCELCVPRPWVAPFTIPFRPIQVGRFVVTPPWDIPEVSPDKFSS